MTFVRAFTPPSLSGNGKLMPRRMAASSCGKKAHHCGSFVIYSPQRGLRLAPILSRDFPRRRMASATAANQVAHATSEAKRPTHDLRPFRHPPLRRQALQPHRNHNLPGQEQLGYRGTVRTATRSRPVPFCHIRSNLVRNVSRKW